jgi:crotonobetainyl-CoA:carnitine CoA-transferase CaiB-like acyl-CoA transferase
MSYSNIDILIDVLEGTDFERFDTASLIRALQVRESLVAFIKSQLSTDSLEVVTQKLQEVCAQPAPVAEVVEVVEAPKAKAKATAKKADKPVEVKVEVEAKPSTDDLLAGPEYTKYDPENKDHKALLQAAIFKLFNTDLAAAKQDPELLGRIVQTAKNCIGQEIFLDGAIVEARLQEKVAK